MKQRRSGRIGRVLLGWSICCCVCWWTPVFAQTTLRTAIQYDLIRDHSEQETTGYELTIPFGLLREWNEVSLSLETAYSRVHIERKHDEVELASFTDTVLSASYTSSFAGLPVSVILGLDLNIPTGKERLTTEEMSIALGEQQDLFHVDNFGEGMNIGASVGVMGGIRNFLLVCQGAYILNGEFDPSFDIENDTFDPGDQLLVLGFLEWPLSARFSLASFISYAHFSTDKRGGEAYFRQADQVVVGGDMSFFGESVEGVVSFQGSFSGHNDLLGDETLLRETESRDGTDLSGFIALTYYSQENFHVWVDGDVRYYGESELEDRRTGLPYASERIRYALGTGFNYRINPSLSWQGAVTVFTMEQEQDVFLAQDMTYDGANLGLGVIYQF